MKAGLLARLRTTDWRRARKVGLLALGALGCMLMVPAVAGVRLNDSPSLPVGLYVVISDRSADVVEFCPTEPYASLAAARGYRSEGSCPDGGAPLMKPIVAQPGDTVEISSRNVAVNGKALPNSAPLNVDTEGRRLLHWPFGKYRVETGTVWVISSYNCRSFDSRYFGPVRENRIRHLIKRFSRFYPDRPPRVVKHIMRTLALSFRSALNSKDGNQRGDWIQTAIHSGTQTLVRFAFGLGRDISAVIAAVESHFSNGQVKGQINRLKMIKRQMYGRAGLKLLHARILSYRTLSGCAVQRTP